MGIEQVQQETETQENSEKTHWAKGALTRGFYSAAQGIHAANLSIITMAPKTARIFGFDKLTGGKDNLIEKISSLEEKIQANATSSQFTFSPFLPISNRAGR